MIGRHYLKWGIGGRLRGVFPLPCVSDGPVNGFAVFTVLFCSIAGSVFFLLHRSTWCSRSLRRIPHLRSQGAGRDRTPCFPCSGGTVFESACRSAFRESVRRSSVSVRATLPRARRYEDGRYVRRGDAMRAQPQREAAYYLPQGAPNRLRHRHDLRGSVRPIGRLCRTAGGAAQCGRGNRQTGTKVR